MLPKFFGQFLLERNVISEAQLTDAVRYQKSRSPKLGELAVQQGFLSPSQADEISLKQRIEDKLFGQIALELDYLTETQLEILVSIQKNSHIFLGEAFVELEVLSAEDLGYYLAEFRKLQQPIESFDSLVPEGFPFPNEAKAILGTTSKVVRRMCDMLIKFGRGNVVEFTNNLHVIVLVELSGKLEFRYFLNLPQVLAMELARKVYQHDDESFDEHIANEFLCELANIASSNLQGIFSQLGHNVIVSAPIVIPKPKKSLYKALYGQKIIEFPASTPSDIFSVGMIYEVE